MDVDATRVAKGMYWNDAWSLVEGCTPCAPECLNCWSAEQTNMRQHRKCPKTRARYTGLVDANGKFNGTVRLMEGDLDKPLRTRKPTVWSVWNDLFHAKVGLQQIGWAWDVMEKSPRHTFLVLTKRPDIMVEFFETLFAYEPLPNVALGTTVGHPDSLWRIGKLLECPASMRFVSCEPLLGELGNWYCNDCGAHASLARAGRCQCVHKGSLGWVIVGPETGPKRRPCKPEWTESLIDQADAAGVPVFIKAFPVNGHVSKDMAEWPAWARRREFPDWGGADESH